MISKITKGSSFNGLMNYLTKEEKRHELLGESMGTNNIKEQVAIMSTVAKQRPKLKKCVFHGSISLEKGKTLDKDIWKEIAHDFMLYMGFADSPYCIIKHNDHSDREHIHLCASRVDYYGNVISDSQDWQKAMDYMRVIEKRYSLDELITPELYQDNDKKLKTRNEEELEKRLKRSFEITYKNRLKRYIKEMQSEAVAKSDNLDTAFNQFYNLLQKYGIEVQDFRKNNGRVYGMTYKFKDFLIKSSKLGKAFGPMAIEKLYNEKIARKNDSKIIPKLIEKSIDEIAHYRFNSDSDMRKAFLYQCSKNGLNVKHLEYRNGADRFLEYSYEYKGYAYMLNDYHSIIPFYADIGIKLSKKRKLNQSKAKSSTQSLITETPKQNKSKRFSLLSKIHGPRKEYLDDDEDERDRKRENGLGM